MKTLKNKIKEKKAEIKKARAKLKRQEAALVKLQIKALEEESLSLWEKFEQWVEEGIPQTDYRFIQHFPIKIVSPEGYPDEINMWDGRHVYRDYIPDWGDKKVRSRKYEGWERRQTVDTEMLLERLYSMRYDGFDEMYIKVEPDYKTKDAMKEAAGDRFLDCSIRIQFTEEHFNQVIETIMEMDLRSFEYEW